MINFVQKILEEKNFECVYLEASESIPVDRLMVNLGEDEKKRKRLLEISSMQIAMPKEIAKENAGTPVRLQFQVNFPFQIDDLGLNQVGSMILFLNNYTDLPGFELNELKNLASYRYIWITNQETFDANLLLNIIGSIVLNLNLFVGMIETLADGQVTFNELLEKVLKVMEDLPSNSNDK